MGYHIKLSVFEGPFELLFHLIKKAEVDIWEISIADITEQYLNYLDGAEKINLELTSEFLVMATTLLRLKSKMLLPPSKINEEEQDEFSDYSINTREELIARLIEYRRFKKAADMFRCWEKRQQKIYFRSFNTQAFMLNYNLPLQFSEGKVDELHCIAMKLLKKTYHLNSLPIEISIKEKIACVLDYLSQRVEMVVMFDELYRESFNKQEIIITFLALLELARQNKVYIWQEKPQGPIFISLQ